MEEVYKSLDKIVNNIINSPEYKKCLQLQDKMNDNLELKELINKVKELQKKYIKSNYSEEIKKELDSCNRKLDSIPIYSVYLKNLEIVNMKIEMVKDMLNDYFNEIFN